jgi:hypothetical protein
MKQSAGVVARRVTKSTTVPNCLRRRKREKGKEEKEEGRSEEKGEASSETG